MVLLPADVVAAAVGVVGGSLAVILGQSGGEVACAAMVDDGTFRTASASGAFATAACGGF
ncbi:hypothetical protein ACFUNF_01120 [Streptomyces sp. NPDC057291]|uniref:hypothetical protein n=1 Tax=Streptomyces sp. NPDC057291 TaxID=3346087 RepID=UPI0036429CC5